ncbi:MAG: DUF58 domain-containing protein [Actinomycetia bacterium]|nr:DUF58 domain-containing protein [Actinomycetes bacterium]
MNQQTSPRFAILLFGGVFALLGALIAGKPDVAAIVSPAVILVVLAAALHQWPDLELSVSGPVRAIEGDRVDLVVTASSRIGIPWLQLTFELPPDFEPVDGIRTTIVSVPPGREVSVKFPVEVTRWGVARPGRLLATGRDRFAMFTTSTVHTSDLVVRVHPAEGHRRSVIAPTQLRSRVGAHLSPRHGEGAEFAEVRPFRIGDHMRALNWRVTARKGEPWVTVRHPDRSGDLVLILDSFTDLGPDGNRLVQRGVRAAMALADANLGTHDRVGLLDVGRHIRWFRPRLGRLHQARLFDRLLETQVEPGLRAPRLSQLPIHELDDGTLIVVITGLVDPDMSHLPAQLANRGLEVVVLDCAADDHLPPISSTADGLTARLWHLQRTARRDELRSQGVTVVTWSANQPLELPVAAVARRGRDRRAGVRR